MLKQLKSLVDWRLAFWVTGCAMATYVIILVGAHFGLLSEGTPYRIYAVIVVMLIVCTVVALRKKIE